jgi:tRNA1(Val) A37 N6-methylase TrmN6
MSSINPYYTFKYSQPSEYRFSHDSVFLARRVFELCQKKNIKSWRVLDLCAGCGIIGLDFIFHFQNEMGVFPASCDFIEVQKTYESHFLGNVEQLKKEKNKIKSEMRFLNANYDELQNAEFKKKYNLILCNPPYFFPHQGTMSPSQFKNRCRFFIDSDFRQLFLGIATSLAPSGEAFLVLRDLKKNGFDVLSEAQALLPDFLQLESIGDIRGNHFIKIYFK